MEKVTNILNQVRDFFDKGFDRIRNIFQPKLVETLNSVKEDLSNNLIQSQNKLKEMANSEVGILSDMENYVQTYCTELVAMKVDGYERYQELLNNKPIALNLLTIKERFETILQYLRTSTIPNTKTSELQDYEQKFSSFFNEIFDAHIDKFPKDSKKRIMLPNYILPYIDKNNPIHIETMKLIKEHIQYKKSQMIEYLKSKCLPILEQKKVEGKVTEQDVSPEDYNNKITLFWKGMEEYSKQPGAQIIRHEDIPDNIEPDTAPYDGIEKTDYNNDKIIQSISIHSPFVTIQYTLKDSPNEIKVKDLDMKRFARHSFEFKTV